MLVRNWEVVDTDLTISVQRDHDLNRRPASFVAGTATIILHSQPIPVYQS